MAHKPARLFLYTYQVGFGDCYLLKFEYAAFVRNVLIDFGSMRYPPNLSKRRRKTWMKEIAEQIREDCKRDSDDDDPRLHVVVATHRHKDHISGFSTKANGAGPGDIIAKLRPMRILQPWTENPRAPTQAGSAGATAKIRAFGDSLQNMHAVAAAAEAYAGKRRFDASWAVTSRLGYLGQNNVKNKSAVDNLVNMGRKKRARYLRYGRSAALGSILPGVKVKVLGPPDLTQSKAIESMTKEDDEFWMLQARAAGASGDQQPKLFPAAKKARDPIDARWMKRRMRQMRAETLMQIVTRLDDVMNNTSLILLFDVKGKKLLFPGDAQLENWQYALQKASVKQLLRGVHVYKVGHHGSRNATPKTLWSLFARRSADPSAPNRLRTLLSTLEDVHGHEDNNSEVPRETLVDALNGESNLLSTDQFGTTELRKVIEIPL